MKEDLLLIADRIVRTAELEYIDAPDFLVERIESKVNINNIDKGDLIVALEENIKNRIDVAFSYNDLCGNLLKCPYLFDHCLGLSCDYLVPGEFTNYRVDEIVAKYSSIIKKVGRKYNIDTSKMEKYLKEKAEFILSTVLYKQ